MMACCERGQSTIEYAIVLGASLCIIVAAGALVDLISDGTLSRHIVSAASHNIQGSAGGMVDVFCF